MQLDGSVADGEERPGAVGSLPGPDGPGSDRRPSGTHDGLWAGVPERLRARGLRWTPQRRVLVDVLSRTDGHVTGAELVERCREVDPGTIPSTVYRTLDVLEELGVLSHSHAPDGREEFHVLPEAEHGHLICQHCGTQTELTVREPDVAAVLAAFGEARGFAVDVSHLTVSGRCADCREDEAPPTGRRAG
jgi:Fur family ferric uptake transcriptional regulator